MPTVFIKVEGIIHVSTNPCGRIIEAW